MIVQVLKAYSNGRKSRDAHKWKIVGRDIQFEWEDGDISMNRINSDDSLTLVASVDEDGKRTDLPKDKQFTLKRIKLDREPTLEEVKLVGIYEGRYRIALRKDMVFELFHMDDGEKEGEGTWIVQNGEVNAADESGTEIWFLRIEANVSLTLVARENDGKREDHPKEEHDTYKKLK